MLQNEYFTIVQRNDTPTADGSVDSRFTVRLIPEHRVYDGHFPGRPVSPGVCTLQMIKECAQTAAGQQLVFDKIVQYRLLGVISPQSHKELNIDISLSADPAGYQLTASVADATPDATPLVTLKAHLTTEN